VVRRKPCDDPREALAAASDSACTNLAAAEMHQVSADSDALCCRLCATLSRVSTWQLDACVLMASRAVGLLIHSLRLQQTCVFAGLDTPYSEIDIKL